MNWLQFVLGGGLSPMDLLASATHLVVASICGWMLATFYRKTYRGPSYSTTFDRSLITLSIITAIVIMIVGNNLARAFGLVGAMSIVRFRTALKDPQDLVFVFSSLAVGLAAGVGLHLLAIVGTPFLGGVIAIMARTQYGVLGQREYVLQLNVIASPGANADAIYTPILTEFCESYRLLGARSSGSDSALSLTFLVQLASSRGVAELTRVLNALPEVTRASAFHDEEPA